jgi:hypothetical protein
VGVGDRNDRRFSHLYGFFKDKINGATGFGVVEGIEVRISGRIRWDRGKQGRKKY